MKLARSRGQHRRPGPAAARTLAAVVLALRFTVLKGVIDQIADQLADKLGVVPSNPLSMDAEGNVSRLLPGTRQSRKFRSSYVAGAGGSVSEAMHAVSRRRI